MVLFYNSGHPNQKESLVGESNEIIIGNAIVGDFDDNDLINNRLVEDEADDDYLVGNDEEEDEDLGEEDEDVDYDTFDDIDEW